MEKQQVKKYTPDTSCTKIPKQLCAPKSCNIVEVVCQRYSSSSDCRDLECWELFTVFLKFFSGLKVDWSRREFI